MEVVFMGYDQLSEFIDSVHYLDHNIGLLSTEMNLLMWFPMNDEFMVFNNHIQSIIETQ